MKTIKYIFLLIIFQVNLTETNAQSIGALDWNGVFGYGETPLHPIHPEMTFEEYQDMNRRLDLGIALGLSIPIPGIVHYYAGEKKMARRLLMVGTGGLAMIITGGILSDEPDWPDTPYDVMILNEGEDDERRFEKVPMEEVGGITNYKLVPLTKEGNGNSGLIVLGAGILVCDILYDWFYGWKAISNKRNVVRYKYGQQLQLSLNPDINFYTKSAGLNLSLNF